MAATDSIPYPLKRNVLASTRLNFNHFWVKTLTGYLLHPSMPTDRDDLRIADLGAGTGLWISELATKLPNARFDAVDISADQFPHKDVNPPNIKWWAHDCTKPFAEEYVGAFDVLNVRYWMLFVNDDVADRVFQNVMTLLKPGGYLQWFEWIPNTARIHKVDQSVPSPACDRILQLWSKPTEHSSYDWLNDLPGTFERNGMQVVAKEEYQNPPYLQPVSLQTMLLGMIEMFAGKPDLEAFQEALAGEFAKGMYVDVKWGHVVGRKAAG